MKNSSLISNRLGVQRELVTDILKYLLEVESRDLHLARGFSSIYAFCVEELGYSEDEAYVRVQAMRCLRAIPEIECKIESGELSLSVVAKAQVMFKRQAKIKKPLDVQQKILVIENLLNVSVRQAEKKLATWFAETDLPREKIKPISEELTKIEFTANQRLMTKLETLKHLLAHRNFDGRMDGLIEEMADIALKKLGAQSEKAPNQVSVAQRKTEKPPTQKRSRYTRYIMKASDRAVRQRAQSQCEYVDPISGRRCSSLHGLQIDHVHEFAKGGSSEFSNLQLLCGAHNRWKTRSNYRDNSFNWS